MDHEMLSVFQDPSQFLIHSSQVQHPVTYTSERELSDKVRNKQTFLKESFILFTDVSCSCNTLKFQHARP